MMRRAHNVLMTAATTDAAGRRTAGRVPQASSPPPLLEIRDVAVNYGPLRALSGVSLAVSEGEIVALAGENGAGKTTLVRCIGGDISPSSGEIRIGGLPVQTDPRALARLGVGVLWQDLALCDNLDIAANLMLGRERRRQMMSDVKLHTASGPGYQPAGHDSRHQVTVRRPAPARSSGPGHRAPAPPAAA
jgi:ABC-type branched-subunit amino acid transport system ATPase component